jgi:hypothetical protein
MQTHLMPLTILLQDVLKVPLGGADMVHILLELSVQKLSGIQDEDCGLINVRVRAR